MQHVYPDVIIVERGTSNKRDVSRVRPEDNAVVDKLLKYTRNDDDDTAKSECHVSDVTDDDISASLKDYTYMYKKDDDKKPGDQTDHDAASDISSVSSSIVDYVRRSLTEVGVSTASGESRDENPPPLPAKTTTQRRAPLHCEIQARQVAVDDVMANTWEPTHMTWDEVEHVRLSSSLKPRPHQQQCQSNIVECYRVECSFDIVAVFEFFVKFRPIDKVETN